MPVFVNIYNQQLQLMLHHEVFVSMNVISSGFKQLNISQILEKSDYTMISGHPFIRKTGMLLDLGHHWFTLLSVKFYCMNGTIFVQVGGRYPFTSTYRMKLKTRPSSLMRTVMSCVLNL